MDTDRHDYELPADGTKQNPMIGIVVGVVLIVGAGLFALVGNSKKRHSPTDIDAEMEQKYNVGVASNPSASGTPESNRAANAGPMPALGGAGNGNRNAPVIGEAAGDEDPTEQFANAGNVDLVISDADKKIFADLAKRFLASYAGKSPVNHATLYDFDRMFWEVERRCPQHVRDKMKVGRTANIREFRKNRQEQLESDRKDTLRHLDGETYEAMELHIAKPVPGRAECVTYWRLYSSSGGMSRLVLWLIRKQVASMRLDGSDTRETSAWYVYDVMDVESNRRESWEIADGWIREVNRVSMTFYNAKVDAVNRLIGSDYTTLDPKKFDAYINDADFGFYRAFLKGQKFMAMISQDTDPEVVHRFARELLGNDDTPEFVRSGYGKWLFATGDYEAAAKHLAEFIEKLGPDDDASSTLGLSYEFMEPKQREKARAAYERWIEVAKRPGSCHLYRAVLDVEDGKFDDAKTRFKAIADGARDSGLLLEGFSEYYTNRAWQPLLELIDDLPADKRPVAAGFYRGHSLFRLGRYDDAIREFETHARKPQLDADDRIGIEFEILNCRFAKGEHDAAFEGLQSLAQRADGSTVLAHAASYHAKLGEWDAVQETLDQLRGFDDEGVFAVARAANEGVPGARELWQHDAHGAALHEWFTKLTEKPFKVPAE